ncbi:MAG: hypothetical protein U0T82_03580 [Bacteroidales bacterium]
MTARLSAQDWKSFSQDSLIILYNCPVPELRDYAGFITESAARTESFFGKPFKENFFVRIHGNRNSFDEQLAQDWHEPNRSECWMVASGSAPGMDLLCRPPGIRWPVSTNRLITQQQGSSFTMS